jgi:acyl carrier protein
MPVSSRTPEGEPQRCPICGDIVTTEPSVPLGDSVCPQCGSLLLTFRDKLDLPNLHWDDEWARMDSLDYVELVLAMEERFDFNIPDEEAQDIKTVGDAIRFLRRFMDEGDLD